MHSALCEKPHYFIQGTRLGIFTISRRDWYLSLMEECGFEIIESRYTNTAFTTPQMSWRIKLAILPRFLAYMINRDIGVRLLGGDALILLAKTRIGK